MNWSSVSSVGGEIAFHQVWDKVSESHRVLVEEVNIIEESDKERHSLYSLLYTPRGERCVMNWEQCFNRCGLMCVRALVRVLTGCGRRSIILIRNVSIILVGIFMERTEHFCVGFLWGENLEIKL